MKNNLKNIAETTLLTYPEKEKQEYMKEKTLSEINKRKQWKQRTDITIEEMREPNKKIKQMLRQDKKRPYTEQHEHQPGRKRLLDWTGIKALKKSM